MSTYYENLERWQELTATIKHLQGEERALREGLFNGTFPDPVEGTNTHELPDGRKVKGVYKIYRKTVEDRLKDLPNGLKRRVFKVKHELKTSAYRDLPEEERKAVDACLDIKPAGLHSLKVVEAKPSPDTVEP